MSHSKSHHGIDEIFRIIAEWVQENLAKAIYQFDAGMEDFKFGRVSQISKFWNENGLWQTEALIEYTQGGARKRNVSFQVNDNFSIIIFNLYEPTRG